MERSIRAKASRPEFRRAGFAFHNRDWVVIAPDQVTPHQVLRLLEEPVLTIEVRAGEDEWRRLSHDERVEGAVALRGMLDDQDDEAARRVSAGDDLAGIASSAGEQGSGLGAPEGQSSAGAGEPLAGAAPNPPPPEEKSTAARRGKSAKNTAD